MTVIQATLGDFCGSYASAPDPEVDALADEIETILTDPTRCTYCATQVREYYPEFDEAEAVHLSVGDTKGAFHAAGHRLAEDGTVDAHHRLRSTTEATRGRLRDGSQLFCGTCGRVPNDAVEGSRPTEWLVEVAQHLLEDADHDVDREVLAGAVDDANDADTDDYHVLARALLTLPPYPPKSRR
ncbi:hypothetical protein [Haloplanus natans]|uniref:hypothetical protein n=1 Tax=Haloplanus natans TaxID=376171 RepID=UPI00067763F2|nr:hypothetical protein [Haloplanus natans]